MLFQEALEIAGQEELLPQNPLHPRFLEDLKRGFREKGRAIAIELCA